MEPAIEPMLDQSIFDKTIYCLQRFGEHISVAQPRARSHARVLAQRLEIWAKYSGATARKGLSLDDRLELHGDIRAAVLGLLDMVLINADNGIQVISFPVVVGNIIKDDPDTLSV